MTENVSASPGMARYFTWPRSPPRRGSGGRLKPSGSRYQRLRYMSPLSWTVSSTSTPTSRSQAGTSPRRPVAATTTSASMVEPSSRRRPTTRGMPPSLGGWSATSTPSTPTPATTSTPGSANAAFRSTHSNVVRRTARTVRSSSPGRASPRLCANGIGNPPAASSDASTSGKRSRRRTRIRARKPWVWRACGAPDRSVVNASSGSDEAGSWSRSTIVTGCPALLKASAAVSPPTLPPTMTIRSTPTPLLLLGDPPAAILATGVARIVGSGNACCQDLDPKSVPPTPDRP